MRNKNRSGQAAGILICGNTDYFDDISLNRLSEYYNVVVTGRSGDSKTLSKAISGLNSHKINQYKDDITSENFRKLMKSCLPDAVWYISGYVDGNSGLLDERKKIEELVQNCVLNEVRKLVFVSSVESLNYRSGEVSAQEEASEVTDEESMYSYNTRELSEDSKRVYGKRIYSSSEAFNVAQTEEQVKYLSEKNNLKTVIIRVPHIFKPVSSGTWVGELFHKLYRNEDIRFPYCAEEYVDFLSIRNFTDLLISVTEETMDTAGEYTALNGYEHTYRELADVLRECDSTVRISFEESKFQDFVLNRRAEALRLKKEYGFIPGDDVLDDIKDGYIRYAETVDRGPGLVKRIRDHMSVVTDKLIKGVELIGLFLVIQLLIGHTSDNVYFRYIDLRLFYVIIMGSMHGMFMGILAGLIQCISLAAAFMQSGVTGSMLFYNTDYWLPFAIYLMTGAISGYMLTSKEQKIKFVEEEAETVQGKYEFLNKVYMSVIDNKEEYKRQILGYQDSFGKIFEAVENLNSSTPADIFMNGVEILENILKNHSIAIYTVDDSQNYARLVACSRRMSDRLSRSLRLDEARDVYSVILRRDTWKNIEFKEDRPQYAYGIVEEEKLKLMIAIYEAEADQLGQYYMNLFTIMCHLIRISLMRAMEYQSAIEREKYIPGTEILVPSHFERELEAQRRMADAGVASFILLELETPDIDETFMKLEKHIRHSDMVGEGEDGKHYLLLTQINRMIFETIGERLRSNDINYRILEGL